MPRAASLSTRLWPLALSLGASMLLHGAVVEVWSAWQLGEGSAVVPVSGVSVRIADVQPGQPKPVTTLARPEPKSLPEPEPVPVVTKLPEMSAPPASHISAAPAARAIVVSQTAHPKTPRLEPALPVQPPLAAFETSITETESQPPAPVVREPTFVMGSPQNPEPAYPFVARKFGWEGLVRVAVDVDASGQPHQVDILASSGHAVLDQSALTTIRDQWQFQPALLNGNAVPGKVTVPVRFALRE